MTRQCFFRSFATCWRRLLESAMLPDSVPEAYVRAAIVAADGGEIPQPGQVGANVRGST